MVWDGGSLKYFQLRDLIETLRPALAADPGNSIGILAYRTPLAYAGVQAILSEGKAYIPLNPIFPSTRNAFILNKAGLHTLIVGEECADALAALLVERKETLSIVSVGEAPRIREICHINRDYITLIELSVTPNHPITSVVSVSILDSAYVLFTSGSTGEPKGVRVSHDNVHSYLKSFLATYLIHPTDRVSQTFDLTFDVSVHDQFITWSVGATLVVFPDKSLFSPLAFAAENKVSVWFSVPSRAAFLESSRQVVPSLLSGLRLSLFAGEKLTWKTCEIWKVVAPNSRIVNLYGPTEATVAVTHFEIPKDFPEVRAFQGGIPIGRVWLSQMAEVRREDGSLCASGELGGLWLAGDQVAQGYLDEPDKTRERFIQRDSIIWYRTGDIVFMESDGIIQYQGREDFQVKVMGYRIELGEIEHAVMRCSGAAYALADVAVLRGNMDEIYCVLPESLASRKKEIGTALKKALPSYMIPRHIFFIDNIPLNPNGKMDRGALKAQILARAQ